MAGINRILPLARFLAGEYLKVPLAFISDLIIPLIIFMIVHLSTGKGVESLIGILIAMAWASGAFTLARKLATYRFYRLLDIFIASPITQLEFAIAAALAHLVILVVPSIIIVTILAILQGGLTWRLPILAFFIIASWGLGVLFGMYSFNKFADPVKISSLANLINLGLIILPPVVYPIDLLPKPLQTIAQIVPTVAIKTTAMYFYGLIPSPPIMALVSVIAYYAIFAVLAVKSAHWGEE